MILSLKKQRVKDYTKLKVHCSIIDNKHDEKILKTVYLTDKSHYVFDNPAYYPIPLTSISKLNRIEIKILDNDWEKVRFKSDNPCECLIKNRRWKRFAWPWLFQF